MFLVYFQLEKVLQQGDIGECADPYIKEEKVCVWNTNFVSTFPAVNLLRREGQNISCIVKPALSTILTKQLHLGPVY